MERSEGCRGAGGAPRSCPLHTAHFGGQGGEPAPRRTGPAQHWETLLVSGRGSSPTPDRALREAFHFVTRAERCHSCDYVQPQWPGTFWGWAHCQPTPGFILEKPSGATGSCRVWPPGPPRGLAHRPWLWVSHIKRSICLKFPLSRGPWWVVGPLVSRWRA